MVVPYTTPIKTTSTTYWACWDSTTSTACGSNWDDDGWVSFRIQVKEEKEIIIPKKEIVFDRVIKMRNTDGRPIKYSTWKPVRMLCGRDNIGIRNFKKK